MQVAEVWYDLLQRGDVLLLYIRVNGRVTGLVLPTPHDRKEVCEHMWMLCVPTCVCGIQKRNSRNAERLTDDCTERNDELQLHARAMPCRACQHGGLGREHTNVDKVTQSLSFGAC
jgi:hypothetical protein